MKTKNLKSIFFLCLVFCTLCLKVNAQIVYTDVNPDISCNTNGCNYNLDLNNDGITDFTFNYTSLNGPCFCGGTAVSRSIYLSPSSGNSIVYNGGASPLVSGNLINSSLTFSSLTNIRLAGTGMSCIQGCHAVPNGNWSGLTDRYLGLKILVNGTYYYGWAKLSIAIGGSTLTIKDYAYNSFSNQPFLAGETSCTTPTVNLTQSSSLTFCAGDSVTLTANGTGYQYQWKKNNINIAGATAKTYTAKTAGIYKCKVTNSCGSKTSGTRTVTVPCRNSNGPFVETLEHLSVYPNPATNSVSIKFPSEEPGEIQIVNLFGQVVYSGKINQEQTQIDVSKFSEGMYIVRWSSGENFETKIFSVIK